MNTVYVYACDQFVACSGAYAYTFYVQGTGGGPPQEPRVLPGGYWVDVFYENPPDVEVLGDDGSLLEHGGLGHWRSYGQDNANGERIILIYDWTGFGSQWRQNARNPALDEWAASARIEFEVRENAPNGTSCNDVTDVNIPTDAIVLCVQPPDLSPECLEQNKCVAGLAIAYDLEGEPGHHLEGSAGVQLLGKTTFNQKIVGHEVGHLLGLGHRKKSSRSIMNFDYDDITPDGHDMNTVFDLHNHTP